LFVEVLLFLRYPRAWLDLAPAGAASLWGITLPWISSAIIRFGVDSFGHLLVFATCHWLHPAAAAGRRAAARERQGDRESQTKADFSEEVVFHFHNCGFHFAVLCLFRY
jgi:hypothetical protein